MKTWCMCPQNYFYKKKVQKVRKKKTKNLYRIHNIWRIEGHLQMQWKYLVYRSKLGF